MPATRWRLTGSISTRSGSTRNRPDPRLAAAAVGAARTAAAAVLALVRGPLLADEPDARQVLAADPYDETALRALMEALTRSGRPASASVAYSGARERRATSSDEHCRCNRSSTQWMSSYATLATAAPTRF
ncbi:MAG TPA: bacterial transcriptional activator domain-containing protein [Pseudonocardiaceae bacterium]|nr:bacterial transcriptional activator domain-containing protein [Pseudonocardiaceae bacterium]